MDATYIYTYVYMCIHIYVQAQHVRVGNTGSKLSVFRYMVIVSSYEFQLKSLVFEIFGSS